MMTQSGHILSSMPLETPQTSPISEVSQAMKVVQYAERHPYLHPDDCPLEHVEMSVRQAIITLNKADEEYL
ncbi:hypothetical protein AB6D11_00760 [Vibrio splendidus]